MWGPQGHVVEVAVVVEPDRLVPAVVVDPPHDHAVTGHGAPEQLGHRILIHRREGGDPAMERDGRQHPTAEAVGRLPEPPAELQSGPVEQFEELRYGVGPVTRMQQRVGQRVPITEVRGVPEQMAQRVPERDLPERVGEIGDVVRLGGESEAPAAVLQHVDPGPSVWRIHHEMHRARRLEPIRQRGEPGGRIAKVVQHARAHDQVEPVIEISHVLDRHPAQLEVGEPVPGGEVVGVADAGVADVDRDDAASGMPDRVPGGLGCPAAGDEDARIVTIGGLGPEKMVFDPEPVRIPGRERIPVEVGDRRRVGVVVVERRDLVIAGARR